MTRNAIVEVLDETRSKVLLELKIVELYGVRSVGELGGLVHAIVRCQPEAVDTLNEIIKDETVFSMCVFYPNESHTAIEESFELLGCQLNGVKSCDRSVEHAESRGNRFLITLGVQARLSAHNMSERGREVQKRFLQDMQDFAEK